MAGDPALVHRRLPRLQQDGLATPDYIRAASDEYLAGEDVFGQWLGERCIVSARIDFTRTSTLYDDWKQWTADEGLPSWSIKACRRLEAMLARQTQEAMRLHRLLAQTTQPKRRVRRHPADAQLPLPLPETGHER